MILSVTRPMKSEGCLDVMGNLTMADCIIGSRSFPSLVVSTLLCDFEVSSIIAEYISTSR